MSSALPFTCCGIASYLAGSIPFGYIIARSKGIDIRRIGSGNIGATNVFRSVGKVWGILTFALDALKGLAPVLACAWLAARLSWQGNADVLMVICALAAVGGHTWPVFLGFKGGKGVATSAGALLGLAPASVGIGIACWIVAFLLTRYVSVASILVAVVVPVSSWFLYRDRGAVIPVALACLGLLVLWRHRTNIRRLMQRTENRFEFGRKDKNGQENLHNR